MKPRAYAVPVLSGNVVEALDAGVRPRALAMESFATVPFASGLCLVAALFAPFNNGWRRRQRRNVEPIARQSEP
jgi:hypothetical protein